MNIVAISQARFNSSRLPGKVLLPLGESTVLSCHLRNIKKSSLINAFWVATTEEVEANEIAKISEQEGFSVHFGSTEDVLDRYYQCALKAKADIVVRLTSDCPLVSAEIIDQIIQDYLNSQVDYCSNTMNPTFPDGMDCEVFSFDALETAWKQATLLSEREHVTPYIWKNSTAKGGTRFYSKSYESAINLSHIRITLDEQSDYEMLQMLVKKFGDTISLKEIDNLFRGNPSLLEINSKFTRNEGLLKSIAKDIK